MLHDNIITDTQCQTDRLDQLMWPQNQIILSHYPLQGTHQWWANHKSNQIKSRCQSNVKSFWFNNEFKKKLPTINKRHSIQLNSPSHYEHLQWHSNAKSVTWLYSLWWNVIIQCKSGLTVTVLHDYLVGTNYWQVTLGLLVVTAVRSESFGLSWLQSAIATMDGTLQSAVTITAVTEV